MSRSERDLISELQQGDLLQVGSSISSLYEVVSLNHPRWGDEYVELRAFRFGSRESTEGSFEYHKSLVNTDFQNVFLTGIQRNLGRVTSLLGHLANGGKVDDINELLVRLEI